MDKSILVTGAFGQIGSELAPVLKEKYSQDNVVALAHQNMPVGFSGPVAKADIANLPALRAIVKKYKINEVYHLAALLSAVGEKDPQKAWLINMEGLRNILELGREFGLKIFWPSSMAVFGPTAPKDQTPQRTILEPTTIYGVTKVAGELLCQYYFLKYGVDVRSVRFPGIISYETEPLFGTTDYATAVFYSALRSGQYICYLKEDTRLPMMYMADALKSIFMIMAAPVRQLNIRTSYNVAAVSFSPKELAGEINKHLPLAVTYIPDERQQIADSWPNSIDDRAARNDWGFKSDYDLAKLTVTMLEKLKEKLGL